MYIYRDISTAISMTELENQIPFSGIDPKGRLKFGVLLEMFQEMADIDASKYNLSVRQTLEHNVTWVLRKYRIELVRYPVKEDGTIRIKTYAEPYRNLYSLRSFKLWNGHGDFLGSAYTWWVLVDINRHRPVRLDKSELMTGFMERLTEELPKDVLVPELTLPEIEEIWKVRWQDLDVNNHTNHAVFFSWALDTVPQELNENLSPMAVESEFMRSIPRTKVRVLSQEVPSSEGRYFLHSLRHVEDDTEYARMSSLWR
ncbi:MAG: thioesterase [Synergistaceae bacterium]|nr:thioesterase [Synergistaceae bacterium]